MFPVKPRKHRTIYKGRPTPTTRAGWALYYAQRYERTLSTDAAVLALWYMLLSIEFDGVNPFPGEQPMISTFTVTVHHDREIPELAAHIENRIWTMDHVQDVKAEPKELTDQTRHDNGIAD